MKKNSLLKNILFVQDSSPCIRTIKFATALKSKGLKVHLAYINRTPDEVYGYGNSSFISLNKLPKYNFQKIKFIIELIKKNDISLLHYHNQPDILGAKIINANLSIPIIYDQHDFLSYKRKTSKKMQRSEKICNEQANGKIYITEKYKELVTKKYNIKDNYLIFPNYTLKELIPISQLPKISTNKQKIHLVYIGLITEHKNKVRNLISYFNQLSKKGFVIHIYPTRCKPYHNYKSIPNVTMHKKLPIKKLIYEITQYDFGILFLNMDVNDQKRIDELKFGAWNKFYDYLSAGLPVITFNSYNYMANIVKKEEIGICLNSLNDITYEKLQKVDVYGIKTNILKKRINFTMENQIHRLINFYNTTLEKFYEKA